MATEPRTFAERAPGEPLWRVGELARRTGLTVRTLHHYGAIGLLVASHRTSGAHRLYSVDDLTRLRDILSLKTMGLPLTEIAQILHVSATTTRVPAQGLIDAQRRHLRLTIESHTRLLEQLDRVAALLDGSGNPSVEQLCDFIRQLSDAQRADRFFSAAQRAALAELRDATPDGEPLHLEWQRLIQAVDGAMRTGCRPDSRRARTLAASWKVLLQRTVGGVPGAAEAARRMYEEDPDALAGAMPYRPTRAMFAFLEAAGRPPRRASRASR